MGNEKSNLGIGIGKKIEKAFGKGLLKINKKEPKEEPKEEPKVEPKEEPKEDPKEESNEEQNEENNEQNIEEDIDIPKIEENEKPKEEDNDIPKNEDIDDEPKVKDTDNMPKIEDLDIEQKIEDEAENGEIEQEKEDEKTDINDILYILLNNPLKKYEIKITPELSLKEIKNQLVKNYNISLDEFGLYSKNEDLSENCDDKLLNTIFKTNEKKELYLYNKSELYEINIENNESNSALKIHDTMKIDNILKMFLIKYNLPQERDIKYYFVGDGVTLNGGKEASFYKLKNAKSIILKDISFMG